LVIKAQVHTGGRGKGVFDNGFKGGVHICNTYVFYIPQLNTLTRSTSVDEVRGIALKMLGHRLNTKQSGPEGKLVSKIFITKRHFIRREMYFAITMDRYILI
jgi:succinyl-CoA synthetase beta subunit